jgi:hypothetical protein
MKTLSKIFQALLGVVALSLTALIAGGRLAWRSIRNRWKMASKWVRRTIVASFFLIALAFAALVAYAIYDDAMGRWFADESLSDDVVVYYFADDTYRVYNTSTEKYTTPRISWVVSAAENDSIGVYAIDDRRGFINTKTGDVVIDAKANDYEKAWVFSDGLAAVMKDGKFRQIGTPREIYQRPVDHFTASFLGDANFLSGRCLEHRGEFSLFATSCGEMLAIADASVEVGKEYDLMFRPEAVKMDVQCTRANSFQAVVKESMYLGEITQMTLECGNFRFDAGEQAAPERPEGMEIHVAIPAEHLICLGKAED